MRGARRLLQQISDPAESRCGRFARAAAPAPQTVPTPHLDGHHVVFGRVRAPRTRCAPSRRLLRHPARQPAPAMRFRHRRFRPAGSGAPRPRDGARQVLSGMDVVTAVEVGPTGPGDRPSAPTLIAGCGLLGGKAQGGGAGTRAAKSGEGGEDWERRVYGG